MLPVIVGVPGGVVVGRVHKCLINSHASFCCHAYRSMTHLRTVSVMPNNRSSRFHKRTDTEELVAHSQANAALQPCSS